jgi:hypothetical protein
MSFSLRTVFSINPLLNACKTWVFRCHAIRLIDADVEDLDDWLAIHQIEHQSFATILDLDNPFNLLDSDWNQEDDFYDWIQQHLLIHEQIARRLGA